MKNLSRHSLIVIVSLLGLHVSTAAGQTSAPVDLLISNDENPGTSNYTSWSPFYIVVEGPLGGWIGLTLDVSVYSDYHTPTQMEPMYLTYEWLRPPVPVLASSTPLAPLLAPGSDQYVGVSLNNMLVNLALVLQYGQTKQTCQPLLGLTSNDPALSAGSREWDAKCAVWTANDEGTVDGSIQNLWRTAFQFEEPDSPGTTSSDSKRFAPSPLAIQVAAHEAGGMTQLNDFLNATSLVMTGPGGVPITNFEALQSASIGISISIQAFVGWNPSNLSVATFEQETLMAPLDLVSQSAALIKLSQTKSINFVLSVQHVTTRQINTSVNDRLIGWYAEPGGFALPMVDGFQSVATFLYRGHTYTSTSYVLNGLYCYFPAPVGVQFNPGSEITLLGLTQFGYYESMASAPLNPFNVLAAVPNFVKHW